jgi:hypothetical protein
VLRRVRPKVAEAGGGERRGHGAQRSPAAGALWEPEPGRHDPSHPTPRGHPGRPASHIASDRRHLRPLTRQAITLRCRHRTAAVNGPAIRPATTAHDWSHEVTLSRVGDHRGIADRRRVASSPDPGDSPWSVGHRDRHDSHDRHGSPPAGTVRSPIVQLTPSVGCPIGMATPSGVTAAGDVRDPARGALRCDTPGVRSRL